MEKNGQMLVFILYGTLGMTKTKKIPSIYWNCNSVATNLYFFCQQDTNCAHKILTCAEKKMTV